MILPFFICVFSFAFAEAQSDAIKVKKKGKGEECDCSTVISSDFAHSSSGARKKIVKGNAYVKGKAFDASTQKPIANVAVEFYYGSVLIAASCSDSLGDFSFVNVPPVKGIIRAKKCGFNNFKISMKEVEQKKTTVQDVILTPKKSKTK